MSNDRMLQRAFRQAALKMFSNAMEANIEGIHSAMETLANNASKAILDVGCWEGQTTLRYCPPGPMLYGIERDERAASAAAQNGIRSFVATLEGVWPVREGTLDAVVSNQVIEHLSNTDQFLAESYRTLKPGGMLIASTENMSSWHNIFALIFGWQAFSLTNISQTRKGIGNPLAVHKDTEPTHRLWQHMRIFSYRGLKELVAAHGFHNICILGAGYYPFPHRLATGDPRHAAFITVTARK